MRVLLDKQKNLLQLDNESGKAGIPHGHQVKVGRSGTRSKNYAAANPWELPLSRHGPMRCELSSLSSWHVGSMMFHALFEVFEINFEWWNLEKHWQHWALSKRFLFKYDFVLIQRSPPGQLILSYHKKKKTRYLVIPVPRKLVRFRCWSEPFSLAASTRWPIKRRVRRELTLKMFFFTDGWHRDFV